jgi:hypothetical protein
MLASLPDDVHHMGEDLEGEGPEITSFMVEGAEERLALEAGDAPDEPAGETAGPGDAPKVPSEDVEGTEEGGADATDTEG